MYTEAMRHIANRFLEILYKSLIMIVDYLKHTGVYNVYVFQFKRFFFFQHDLAIHTHVAIFYKSFLQILQVEQKTLIATFLSLFSE